ncbi:MAG: MFS transporter, partial [Micrococcaceae bacterium]|nr:MFS transporter [Micrococcaceae bacterium]
DITGNVLVPGIYMSLAGIVGFIAILCMRETSQASLRGEDLPGDPGSVGWPSRKWVQVNRTKADAGKAMAQ